MEKVDHLEPFDPTELPRRTEVVVVGASIAGSAVARALGLLGREVLLVDARPLPDPRRLAGEMMHPRGAQVLHRLGMLPALEALGAVPVRGFSVWGGAEGPEQLLDYDRTDPAEAMHHGVSLHHHELVGALRAVARQTAGVQACLGRAVDLRLEDGRVRGVVLEQEGVRREVRADLVVVADGRHSRLRGRLGIAHQMAQPSMSIGVPVPADALPHPDRGHVFLGAWGPCLAYPVGRADARVVVDAPLGTRPGTDLMHTWLREYAPVFPPRLREAVTEGFGAGALRFAANHDLQVETVFRPGAVLVGDANGIVHPLTAAGMTLSLYDAELLAATLGERTPGGDAGEPAQLARFARGRARFAWARVALCHALYDVFRGEPAENRRLQRAILARWDRSPGARRRTMALLSAQRSSPRWLVQEYAQVLGRALAAGPAWRPAEMRSLVTSSVRRLRRELPDAVRDWVPLLAREPRVTLGLPAER